MTKKIKLSAEYITLGQVLKELQVISSGGQAKYYLAENTVLVNNDEENRRGRKLYSGDQLVISQVGNVEIIR